MKIHDVEQNTDAWHRLRAGIPTASEAGSLVTSTGKESKSLTELAKSLAGDLYAGEPVDSWQGNSATQRGHDLEQDARDAYTFITGKEVKPLGFVTDDLGLYGASPDGEPDPVGLVEIKCLMKKAHIETLDYYDKNDKAPPTYIPQCQMQMFVAERKWCDLFYYHPKLPSLIIRQYPDIEFQIVLKSQIKAVIIERDRLISVLERS